MRPQSPQLQFNGSPALPGIEGWRKGDVQEAQLGEGTHLFGHVEGDGIYDRAVLGHTTSHMLSLLPKHPAGAVTAPDGHRRAVWDCVLHGVREWPVVLPGSG